MLISIKISSNSAFLGSDKPRMLFFPLINVKAGKFSCSVELSMKKSFITSGPGNSNRTHLAFAAALMVKTRTPLSHYNNMKMKSLVIKICTIKGFKHYFDLCVDGFLS